MTIADLREALHDVLSEHDESQRPRLYRILRAMAIQAELGNVRAASLLLDRTFGAQQIAIPQAQQRHTIYIDAANSGNADQTERPADASAAVAE